MFRRGCYGLLLLEILLGVAHLLWPEYRWGQGRRSYFHLGNSLTLASWLAGMQLAAVAVLALTAFHRERRMRTPASPRSGWGWLMGGLAALGLSFAEITRFHHRLELLGYPDLDLYERFVVSSILLSSLVLFGWFLLRKLRTDPPAFPYGIAWLVAWGLELALIQIEPLLPESLGLLTSLGTGLARLSGCTFLLMALGTHVLRPKKEVQAAGSPLHRRPPESFPGGSRRFWILAGVGGTAFTMIFLQIILFQMLTIFGDYLIANSVISVALLGISVGGLIGFFLASRVPLSTMIGASLLLPVSILAAFGTTVSHLDSPLLASILMTLPFVCCSTVITVVLVRASSHLVYCIDLFGAAIGALLIGPALGHLREETSLLFLAAFTLLVAGCFIAAHPSHRVRMLLSVPLSAGLMGFLLAGGLNLHFDWLNIVRTRVLQRYPEAKVLFSRSSLVGRYDVIRRSLKSRNLKALENGRTIDTIRPRPTGDYRIDPRLPHTLMKDPIILIIGVSGDGITKTAKALGKKVYGVEINPAIVSLQTRELKKFNGNSYEDIELAVVDGRSYVEQSDRKYDMITLMNAHFAKGRTSGRSASPEYLHTREAMASYLEKLTDRGVLIVEEPVDRPRREPPVWKQLVTMRQALLDHGSTLPERHFFIFQWKTKRNHYIQILMKKEPFTGIELRHLRRWLQDVDDIEGIEARLGRRMGPIRAKTTLLYAPDEPFANNFSRILGGNPPGDFLRAHNLRVTTDDRPFPFDVNPSRSEVRQAYHRTLLMMVLLLPFFGYFLTHHRSELRNALPFVLVASLTGMGYLLVEVLLIQRYGIFLGSPVVTFSTVLGSLLIFSGLGSLWSGALGSKGLKAALGALFVMLLAHLVFVPALFPLGAALTLPAKIALAVGSLAPLAFFMGVPFPFALRTAKERLADSAAAMLFAINAAASALAVPLALNLSTARGLNQVFLFSILIYAVAAMSLIGLQRRNLLLPVNRYAFIILAAFIASPWLVTRPAHGVSPRPGHYSVYGISYGHSSFPQDRAILGGSASKKIDFEWMLWLIQGKERTVLVDTGFLDPRLAEEWGIRKFVRPPVRLARFGISPVDVTDVILTHAHWDHIGGLAAYRNANIWIQEKEYQHARSLLSETVPRVKGMRWKDIRILLDAEQEGRLVLVTGERSLAPGITMTPGGSHTPGSQYVTVETLSGPILISGDTTYLYENNFRHRPIGKAVDFDENLATIREMHRRAASPFFILPGHDPRVMKWFPEVSEAIVHITTVRE